MWEPCIHESETLYRQEIQRQELFLSPPIIQDVEGKKAKGKMGGPAPAKVMKKQEVKKVMNPLFEKRPKNFGIGQDIQLKETSPTLLNSATFSYSGKGLFSTSM